MTTVTVTDLDRVDGTVVTFEATDDDGCRFLVAVEPRYARAIIEALPGGPVTVTVEPWQILGGSVA